MEFFEHKENKFFSIEKDGVLIGYIKKHEYELVYMIDFICTVPFLFEDDLREMADFLKQLNNRKEK